MMTVTDERTVSLRVAGFRIDIGDPIAGESPSLELSLVADQGNTAGAG